LLGLFVSLLTFYRKGALFSIPFGFYWIINTPDIVTTLQTYSHILDEMEQKESRQVDLAMEELYHAK
ncbi:hypothetical protein P4524_14165, partial [Geobacillus stearothermophilus]|nr:hypothetical protein [Geobacillus stearothermophilus]